MIIDDGDSRGDSCRLTAACKRQFADKVPFGMGFLPQWVTRKHVGGDHLGEIWGAYWVTHDRNTLNLSTIFSEAI